MRANSSTGPKPEIAGALTKFGHARKHDHPIVCKNPPPVNAKSLHFHGMVVARKKGRAPRRSRDAARRVRKNRKEPYFAAARAA